VSASLALVILGPALAVSVVTDLRERRILNAVTYPALLLAVVAAAWTGLVGQALLGALICAGPLAAAMWRGWMGAGDVKLMAVTGLLAGAAGGWPLCLAVLFDVAVAGGVLALAFICAARIRRQPPPRHVPYAVAIAAGAAWALWAGTPIS